VNLKHKHTKYLQAAQQDLNAKKNIVHSWYKFQSKECVS
jgi:hypothetical protein